jgi:hypothetical protein
MNSAEIMTMQQDAIRRVKEMQRRSLDRVSQYSPPIQEQEEKKVPKKVETGNLFEKFNLDNEKLMILVLIIVLINEGADMILILALVYLLL